MPKGWFFEIHEDTPEQEAANLMEHSASVLDISSDDDAATKARNEELERGKENIPPPDFALQSQPRTSSSDATGLVSEVAAGVKMPRLREVKQDAMDEDRKPLGDLPAAEFYGEGCDAKSYVTVDAGIERPSGLSREFEFGCVAAPEVVAEEEGKGEVSEQVVVEEGPVEVYADENAAPAAVSVPVAAEEVAPSVASEPQPVADEAT